jgi:diadenosine tetraphosphatase ApaH/serine/threonine PP2A family protein phosphatase
VCAGDLVGYGPHPNECVAILGERGIDCVAGNHDLIAIGKLGFERTDALARTTLEWTRGALGHETRAFLERLPLRLDGEGLVVAHGSLDDPCEYVRTDEAAAAQLAAVDAPLVVLGHTHTPYALANGRGPLLAGRAGTVELRPGDRALLNPGSVGQARERRPVARLLIVDTTRGTAEFRGLAYDHRRTRAALVERGLPPDAYHRRPTLRARLARLKAAASR